ncbi:MAG TPA: cytochrome c [Acidobacteriaceae bacterium]|nr:cytochrome c [Acidobacteriaceae bacterium]
MRRIWIATAILGLAAVVCGAEVNQDWLKRVPAAERERVNPYRGSQRDVAAGGRLYEDYCARCHGADLQGTRGKPSLRSDVVQNATDGELFWLLKNGDLRHGMPSWSSLPEAERWQILAYVRSAHQQTADARPKR